MRNIHIRSNDIQSFKTIIEILSGIVSDVNIEIIKDKNAYMLARKGLPNTEADKSKIRKAKATSESEEASDNGSEDDGSDDVQDEDGDADADADADVEDAEPDTDSEDPNPKKITAKGKGKSDKTDKSKPVKQTKQVKQVKQTKQVKQVKSTKPVKSDKSSKSDKSDKSSKSDKSKKSKKVDDESSIDDDDKKENPGQIKILTSNEDHVMLIFMTLDGQYFDEFEIIGKEGDPNVSYTIGLDVEELNKFMKTVNKQGTLSIYQDTAMLDYICFNVTDMNVGQVEKCDLRRINIEKPPDKNIEVNVSMVVRMPCALFHTTCKNLQNFDPFVEFICDRDSFRIVCMGEQSNNERQFFDIRRLKKKLAKSGATDIDDENDRDGIKITLSKDIEKENLKAQKRAAEGSDYESDSEDDDDEEPEVISLLFDLRYINYMYKCQNLCDYVCIHLTPRGIMFLSYEISMLGSLLVGIAPKNPDNDNDDDDDNDKYYEDKPIKMKRSLK